MKLARKILVKVLGIKGYLKLVSRTYLRMMRKGKMQDQYHELRFVEKIVQPGYTILDIGANLGYYSWFMAKYMGKEGRLIAVEPIPLFAEVWMTNMKIFQGKNIHLENCALGSESKEKVKMSIPVVDGVVRHGLTKVVEGESDDDMNSYIDFYVPMKIGDELLESLSVSQLDYVKCDVEGFEQYVIPSLYNSIDKFKPLFQIELSGVENRQNVADYLVNNSYEIYVLNNDKLVPVQKSNIFDFEQDFYFIPSEKISNFAHLFS